MGWVGLKGPEHGERRKGWEKGEGGGVSLFRETTRKGV